MQVLGEVVQSLNNVLRKAGTVGELLREGADLLGGGDLTSQQKPQQGFGQRLATTLGLRKLLLKLGDGETTEADTLVGIEKRCLPNHGLDITHTSICLLNGASAEELATDGFAEMLNLLLLAGDDLLHALLKTRVVRSSMMRVLAGARD